MIISLGIFFIFYFFDIFIFPAVRWVKDPKMAQDDNKKKINISKKKVAVDISGTIYHMIVIYGTLV